MSFNITPYKPRPPPGQQGSTPFRSSSVSKFRSSLVPSSRPSPPRALNNPPTKVIKTSTGARDLFRTSTPRSQRTTKFAPDLPAEASRSNASVRKFAPQRSVSTGMSNTASTEPFKMRIPSPDPDLTGEALAKEVPDDPDRTGSIYADQFLAHKCPPHFDELQRRQFFCVLDLRRLKYAADEIFAKKDWKLNILNFAKEYEKSRGLIMLRYGLYEFKNVKPSSEVLKKWRAAHGLPPEPEGDHSSSHQTRRTPGPGAGSTKRKAEEELAPKDNTLMASTANRNKRRNLDQEVDDPLLTGPAPFKKSKRKVDETEGSDENQPNKLQKSTPSAATSLFENILNKTRNGMASPSKQSSQPSPLFGVSKPNDSQDAGFGAKANPFEPTSSSLLFGPPTVNNTANSSASVLTSHKIGSTPTTNTGNIFSYLSESPGSSSGNENEKPGDGESDSEPEHDSEGQEPSTAVSTGTSTPPVQNGPSLFATGKTNNASNVFGGLSNSVSQTAKGGLFGRIQMGANGQPVRATLGTDEQQDASAIHALTADEQQNKTPAKVPGDYTFNPTTTPISFGQPASDVPKSSFMTGVGSSLKPAQSDATQSEKPVSIFGLGGQASSVLKPDTPSLFGSSDSTKPESSETPVSIFPTEKPAPASASIFGVASTASAARSPFESNARTDETPSTVTKKQAINIFNKPTTSVSATSETEPGFNNVEGRGNPSLSAAKDPVPNIFGKSFIAKNATQVEALPSSSESSHSLFSRSSNPLFGGLNGNGSISASTKSIFGRTDKQDSTGPTSNNGTLQTPDVSDKGNTGSALGLEAVSSTTSATSIFDMQGSSKPAAPPSAALFGEKKPDEPAKPASSIFSSTPAANGSIFGFGSQPASNTNTQASSITFGANSVPSPAVSFGTSSSQANGNGPKKIDVQFGSSAPGAGGTAFTFGQDSSSGSGFSFTAGGNKQTINNPFASNPNSQSSAPVFGGNSSASTPSSSFNFSFGQQPQSTPKATPSSQGSGLFRGLANTNGAPSFSFTQATPSQNTPNITGSKAPAPMNIFGHLQASGEGSTGANSPFPAPSSMGTTPVNGTPEPQAPHEDGDEAPQQQISLTEGGPGEEDETILHEVRAKAIKYIPVQQGDEDEGKKSPWSTRGVGPLRVLKSKATGAVRILLRAEPRGHIALNKTILSDIEYKVKDKTVNFVAASDDGSTLETWVLQVKKAEFAQQLAGVLEANKSANKK